MDCRVSVEFVCLRKHKTKRPCHQANDPCRACQEEDRLAEKRRLRDQQLDNQRLKNAEDYARQLQGVEDEIEHQRKLLKDQANEQERKSVLKRRQEDLEGLKRFLRMSIKFTSAI